jgi:hypothetical protein
VDARGRLVPPAAEPPSGSRRGRVAAAWPAVLAAAVRTPVARRSRAELLYCVLAAPIGIGVPVAAVGLVAAAGRLAPGPAKPQNASIGGLVAGLLILVVLATRLARGLGAAHRHLAARLLGERVAAPAPFRPGRGIAGRPVARLRDGTGWRAAAYLLL